jgi:hypothetical protein
MKILRLTLILVACIGCCIYLAYAEGHTVTTATPVCYTLPTWDGTVVTGYLMHSQMIKIGPCYVSMESSIWTIIITLLIMITFVIILIWMNACADILIGIYHNSPFSGGTHEEAV